MSQLFSGKDSYIYSGLNTDVFFCLTILTCSVSFHCSLILMLYKTEDIEILVDFWNLILTVLLNI